MWTYDAAGHRRVLEPIRAPHVQRRTPAGKDARRPLHWPLVFPEVFADADEPGFDAIIGNPPFLGGQEDLRRPRRRLPGLARSMGRPRRHAAAPTSRPASCSAPTRCSPRGPARLRHDQHPHRGGHPCGRAAPARTRGWTVRRGTSPHPWPSASANSQSSRSGPARPPDAALAVLTTSRCPTSVSTCSHTCGDGPTRSGCPRTRASPSWVQYVLGLGFTLTRTRPSD